MKNGLRQRAEQLLQASADVTPVVPTGDVQKLVHELQVHQVELEMQNEELRQTQVELAQSRDAYAQLYDFAPVGYLALDRDGTIVQTNHTAATLLGVDRGKLAGSKLAAYLGPDAPDDWHRHWLKVLGGDDKQTIALAMRRTDGQPFVAQIESCLLPGGTGEGWRAMVALIDITARKAAEEALREARDNQEQLVEQRTAELRQSEHRFRALTEFLPQPIWETDLNGVFTYSNRAGLELLGYSDRDIEAGVHVSDVIAPEDRERIQQNLLKLIRGEDISNHEYTCAKKDGTTIPVLIYSTLIMSEGRPSGVRGITLDISERKQAEQLRERQQARLQRLAGKLATAQDDERRRIAEGLHDDVAQLLTACSAMLGVVAMTHDAAKRQSIVEDVDGYLSEAGEKVRSLSFDLSSATLYMLGLRAALQELCGSMNSRHNMQFALMEGPPVAVLDDATATAVFRSARELLFNVVRHAGVREARVSVAQEGNALLLTVEDDGKGFAAGDDTGEPDIRQGLGLFCIETRLRELGGTMQIDSTPGEGARVTLRIPMHRGEESEG